MKRIHTNAVVAATSLVALADTVGAPIKCMLF